VAKSNSTTEQLDIAKNLLAVTQQMAAAVDAVNKKQMDQVQIMTQIQDAMKALDTKALITSVDAATKAINDLTAKLGNLGKTSQQTLGDMSNQAKQAGTSVTAMATAVNQAGNAASNTSNSVAKLATAVQDNNKKTEKAIETWEDLTKMLKERFPKSAIFASGALSGLTSGFGAVGAGIGFAIDAFKNVVDAILEIGKAIIALPFDFLDFLTEKANKLASGSSEWFAAVQEVKKAYGDLQQTASSALISMAKNNESLEGTGLNARRMWGSAGAQLKAFLDMSVGLGATFDSFADEFKKTGKQLPSFMKGLGLTGEEFRSLTMQAKITGQSVTSVAVSFTKQSLALSKQFGVSAKLISKDMAKALGDVKHFGGATVKQIASASVYARKLGLELEKITGTLDAFETFESAADNASKLSQAFGVNIDAFKMMEAQDPATQLDMLRKSFAAAGKDASSFNRQQLSLLESATGLDAATAKQAFSLKNQGVSLDKINKKSDEAEKRQIDQIKALRELKGAMDLVSQSGSSEGGFLDKFLQGVTQGFERTSEFRGLMRNMIGTFHVLRQAGRELGEAIMKTFPGMKMFFEGLKEIFDPKKFRQLAGGIVDELKKFFKEFMSGKYSFKQLMENITGPGGVFDKFMGAQGSAGQKVVEGFKTMWTFVTKVSTEAIRWLSEKVASGIKYIGRLISGKEKLTDGGAGSFLSETLGPIWEALKDAWKNISPVLLEMLESVGDKIWNWASTKLIPMLEDIAPYVIGAIFGGAALKGLLSLAVAGFGKLLASQLAAVIGKVGATVQGAAAGAGTAVADAAKSAAGVDTSNLNKQQIKQLKRAQNLQREATNAANRAAAITNQGGAVAGAAGKVADAKAATDATAATAAGAGKVDAATQKFNPAAAANMGLKLLAIAGALALGGVALALAVKAMVAILKDSDPTAVWQSIGILTAAALASLPMMLAMNMASGQSPGQIIQGGLAIAGSMLAMGGVAVAIVALSKLVEGAKWETIGQLLVVMASMVLLTIPMLGVMFLAAKIPLPGVLIGALTMTVGVMAMAGTALAVVEILSGLNPQDVENAAKILDSVSMAFLMMVPILLGATAIGVVLVGTLGIGAALMTSGMTALALGVMAVATTAVDILKKLQEANLNSSVGPAIDSFMKVMEVVVKMFDGIGGMFETLLEQDFKKGETAASRLDAGGRFIKSLLGEAGKGTGIIGIAETLLNAARSVKTEDLGPSAEVFTNLLASIPGILTGLQPSDAFYKAVDELGGDDDEVDAMVRGANRMTEKRTLALGALINTLAANIGVILSLPMPDPEKAKGVGAILSGLGGLMQSLMPDPKLMEMFRFKTDGGMLGTSMEGINFTKLGTFFTTYLGSLKDTLPALSSGIITSLVNAVAGIPVDQIGKLAGIGTILGALGDLINSLSTAQKNNPIKMQEVKVGPLKMLLPVATTIADVVGSLKSLGPVTGSLIEGVKTLVSGMPTGTSADVFEKQVKLVVSLFSLLKSIPELASAVKQLDTVPGAKDGAPPTTVKFDMGAAISRISEVLESMVSSEKGDSLKKLMDNVSAVSKFLGTYNNGATLSKVAEKVTVFFDNLKKMTESITALKQFGTAEGGGKAVNTLLKLWGMPGVKSPIEAAMESLSTALGQIAPHMPGIVGGISFIKTSLGTVNPDKAIGAITTFLNSFSSLGTALEDMNGVTLPSGADIRNKFSEISNSLGSLASAFGQTPAGFVGAVQGVNLSQVETALANVEMTKLKSISTNFFDLSLYLSRIKAGFENVTGTFNTAGIGTALTGLTDVVDKVNALNSQLNEINAGKVQIRAGLQTLARGLGIGGSKTEVRLANREVVINLDIQVEMDAGEVEKAMVYRSKSIIRDRLNFATQNPGLTGTQGLPIGKDQKPPERLTATGGSQRKDL
jgi:hypothetical protein